MSSFQKILNKSKKFPNNPGIYWFSKKGKRIYIGKAGSLKKRIASYFRASDPRIKIMVSEADTVSFKKTNSILEAVILEANAIKKYLPKYNIKEKDNRSFVYLIVSKGDFPKIFIARGREVEKYASRAYIFGPYQSYRILKTALNLARKIFPFGICLPAQAGKSNQGKPGSETLANVLSDKTLTLKAAKVLLPGKPCFDYQIGLCPGICIGVISNKDYQKNIKNLILFFKGEHKRLFKKLKKPARHKLRSQALAGGENPEKIFALKHVQDVALINNSKIENLKFKIENLSMGPYVLTGGEIPAMVLIDSVSRQIPGVLGKQESLEEKREMLGAAVYTRPEVFEYKKKKYKVPKILLSGNYKKIAAWRTTKIHQRASL